MEIEYGLTAWICELEGSEADIIQSFIVKDHALISIFNQLMHREGCIVGLDHSIRDLRRGENREGQHHSVRIFFPDL